MTELSPVPEDGRGLLDTSVVAAAARAFGRVAAAARGAGRKPQTRSYDAMIAAVALARGLPLYTANPDDVPVVPGLRVIAVPST